VHVVLDHTPPTAEVRELFLEYAASLAFPLDFQDFEREVADLPGAYEPPRGALVVARADGAAAGCVGLRPLDETTCEMKRLYVRPEFRGAGIGRTLAKAAVRAALARGFGRMRLDTVAGMETAQALYEDLGFVEIAPYRPNPIAGVRYLELQLR
jgi:ribosomal protein S18 acetylase RimI-like enzyme